MMVAFCRSRADRSVLERPATPIPSSRRKPGPSLSHQHQCSRKVWVPAFAGMTKKEGSLAEHLLHRRNQFTFRHRELRQPLARIFLARGDAACELGAKPQILDLHLAL